MPNRDRIESIGSDREKAALIIYDAAQILATAIVAAARTIADGKRNSA